MSEQETKQYKVLDWLILGFFIVFILSLSNSIFINQVGYFGALLFIIIKYFLTRKNPFSKTGLELAFILYMLAEILSLVFTDYKAEALHNFSKRALLIPVFYTSIAATSSLKKGKSFFYVFIAASLVTCLVYLAVSIPFYLNNQYTIAQSGPALIQNPITTSEIISFTVLFLFAFILNEKTDFKTKILLYSGFAISLLTLIATYKRTGWMGVAFSIILLLIIKKKWKILIPVFLLGIILLLTDKNISKISVYDFAESKTKLLYSFNTEGRPNSITQADSFFVVSDYENGLLFYKDSSLIRKIETPGFVISFSKNKNNLYAAYQIDTRLIIYKREGDEIKQVNEILPPGTTKDYKLIDDNLYTLDIDSGLTLYENIGSEIKPTRMPKLNGYKIMYVDSSSVSQLIIFASEDSGITIYSRDGLLPGKFIAHRKSKSFYKMHFFDNKILECTKEGLKLLEVVGNEIVLKDEMKNLTLVHKLNDDNGKIAILCTDGTVYKMKITNEDKFEILAQDKISPAPTNINYSGDKLYCTYLKRGRFLSFFDPYLVQNFTRVALWRAGLLMLKDYPLFGVGDVDLAKYYLKYKRPFDKEIHGHLHNNYMHFLATLGLFGFSAIIFLFIMIINLIMKIYKDTKDKPFIASYSLGALASFVSILVAGLSELNFWDHEIATLIYFTVGLNVALYIHYKKENQSTEETK